MTNFIFKEDVQEIFERAIANGVLSDNMASKNYAGNFMYMYSDGDFDYFKDIITRQYTKSKVVG